MAARGRTNRKDGGFRQCDGVFFVKKTKWRNGGEWAAFGVLIQGVRGDFGDLFSVFFPSFFRLYARRGKAALTILANRGFCMGRE
jgi:hypothetical protein